MSTTCGLCTNQGITWASYLARGVYEPAFGDSAVEADLPVFSASMYPKGVNGDFHNCNCLAPEEFMSNLKNRLENSELRDVARSYDQVMDLMRSTGLREGAHVLDVGAGTGLFLEGLSAAVGPGGKVYVTEVSEQLVSHLKNRVAASSLSNVVVQPVAADTARLDLVPEGSVDLALICDVYHHFEYPKTAMRAIRRTLKPGSGRLILIDFIRHPLVHKSRPYPWIMEHLRADHHKFRREVESTGFDLISEPVIPSLQENCIMVFKTGEPRNVSL